jgi:hypothetical protein
MVADRSRCHIAALVVAYCQFVSYRPFKIDTRHEGHGRDVTLVAVRPLLLNEIG